MPSSLNTKIYLLLTASDQSYCDLGPVSGTWGRKRDEYVKGPSQQESHSDTDGGAFHLSCQWVRNHVLGLDPATHTHLGPN